MTAQTLPECFLHTTSTFPDRPAYATQVKGSYQFLSWKETRERVFTIAAGLLELGLKPGDRLGILAPNRLEWMLADMGALLVGIVVVPVYPSLPAGQVGGILADCRANAVVVSDKEQLEKIAALRGRLVELQHVIRMPDCPEMDAGPGLKGWDLLVSLGDQRRGRLPEEIEQLARGHRSDEVFTFIYTSGTTGDQKGVMLTHRNILHNVAGACENFPVCETDSFLSFLPLSHVFERMAGYYFPMCVGALVLYARDMSTVGEDLTRARPTVMISVPRLFEKIHARIMDNVDTGPKVKQKLFAWALTVGARLADLAQQGKKPRGLLALQVAIADRLVFSRIRQKTGGRLRFMVSGGAPLARFLGDFFLGAGMRIVEGYGLTESSPVITANTLVSFRFGTVGHPFPGVEVKIAPDGEILARGPNIMAGYYNNPDATREAIVDGWLHTGDIGHFDPQGFLRITDRKKNLIVTSGGKNVAPQPIEKLLCRSPLIEQCMLIGDRRNFISALIVPNFERLQAMMGGPARSLSTEEIAEHPDVYKRIEDEIRNLSGELARHEQVRRFVLLGNEFSIDAGELTPKLEVKRHFVVGKYHDLIEQMYTVEA
ncbi:MAG: long-chain fatty acid--CoA ligase [Candidatus Cloacimonetes bacterium]|nr:long-chain fatty acid--CoA ligase [Candidatus Cloacimonadota bacterium]